MSKPGRLLFEVCANSMQSAINAEAGGADRIEICQNLDVGGITPSYGLIQLVMQTVSVPVHVLIRPRPGNFIYSDDEFQIMLADIQACHMLGVDGIVVGMLDANHQVDMRRMRELVQAAAPMQVTFHRAFDDAINRLNALEDVISLQCSRILTVGGANAKVDENAEQLAELVGFAGTRIVIMPGGGLSANHLDRLLEVSGATEFHGSATSERYRKDQHRSDQKLSLESKVTSTEIVRSIVAILRAFEIKSGDQSNPPAYVP